MLPFHKIQRTNFVACPCETSIRQSSCVVRKRHTDRGVSSTPSVVLYWGIPPQTWTKLRNLGYPLPSDMAGGGVPHPCWGIPHLGYPLSDLVGGTLARSSQGGYPRSSWGGTPLWTDRRTDTCQNITFPRMTDVNLSDKHYATRSRLFHFDQVIFFQAFSKK